MRRLLIILAAVLLAAGGPLAAPGAAAGGFAVTYLDPLPGKLVPGTSYTVGFWVLQHGNHPFQGDLGATGLRLTDAGGQATLFPGTALPEAGHYATALNVPKGTYRVDGIQGLFEPFAVGTLTVPGGIELNPLQPGLVRALDEPQTYWGAIRPPGFPEGDGPSKPGTTRPGGAEAGSGEPGGADAGVAGAGASPGAAAVQAGAAGGEGSGFPLYALLIAAAGGALLALAAVRVPRRRHDPGPPVDDKSDTITIGG